jgi:hypothetical protein
VGDEEGVGKSGRIWGKMRIRVGMGVGFER